MRKTNHYYIYPAYFEAGRSRHSGRRVPKKLALPNVDIKMIAQAAQRLGLEYTLREDARYPATWWGTPGLVLIKKPPGRSKAQLLKELAQLMKTLKATAAR